MPRWLVGFWLIGARLLAFQPTFHSDTRLVQINVVVHGKNGPVANLTKDDFSLTDRGKPRAISVFSMISDQPGAADAPALPRNTFSNQRLSGESTPPTVTVILLDRLNTLTGAGAEAFEEHATWIEDQALASARQHLIRFVATLGGKVRVAIYSLGESLSVVSDFTSDRERLRTALENYQPVSLTSREVAEPLAVHTPAPCCAFDLAIDEERRMLAGLANRGRAETTAAALASIAAHVANVPGRKNLVWLTANLPFSTEAAARVLSRAGVAVYPVDARGLLPQSPPLTMEDAASRAVFGRSGVAAGQDSQPTGISSMLELAQETGGRAFVNGNDLAGAIRQAVQDAAITYTLGFYADTNSLDGRFHELRVRVRSAGYEVRYPRGYFADRDGARVDQNRVREAMLAPLELSAIRFLARTERVGTPPGSLRIAGAIDLRDLELTQSAAVRKGAVDVYVVQQDAAGKLLDGTRQRYNLQLTERLYADYLKSGILFREAVTLKESLATLRVLVADPSGSKVGSIIIPAAALQ